MQSEATFKAAIQKYSRFKPHLIFDNLYQPTVGSVIIPFPEGQGIFGVQSFLFGDQASFDDVFAAQGTAGLWDDSQGYLFLSTAATVGLIPVVWKAEHQPVEVAGVTTWPTIPERDLPIIEDIEQALMLEVEASNIEKGPMIYQVGQTMISRRDAPQGLRTQAAQLWERIRANLGGTVAANF